MPFILHRQLVNTLKFAVFEFGGLIIISCVTRWEECIRELLRQLNNQQMSRLLLDILV